MVDWLCVGVGVGSGLVWRDFCLGVCNGKKERCVWFMENRGEQFEEKSCLFIIEIGTSYLDHMTPQVSSHVHRGVNNNRIFVIQLVHFTWRGE